MTRKEEVVQRVVGISQEAQHLITNAIEAADEEVFETMYLAVLELFEEEDFAIEWMTSPIPVLSGKMPIEFAGSLEEAGRVMRALGAMKYGEFA